MELKTWEFCRSLSTIFLFLGPIIALIGTGGSIFSSRQIKIIEKVERNKIDALHTAELSRVEKENEQNRKKLDEMTARDEVTLLRDKALSQGSREAYLHLEHIVEHFGPNRNAAKSGLAQINSRFITLTTIREPLPQKRSSDGQIKDESAYTTKELIETMFFDSQYLFRARSAQLLANRKENFVPEALILTIFSDKHIEVVREATNAFGKITGDKSSILLDSYGVFGFWRENSERIKKEIKQINDSNTIPWKKFCSNLKNNIENKEYKYMTDWWVTAFEITGEFIMNQANNEDE